MNFTIKRENKNKIVFTDEQEKFIVDMYENEKMSKRDIGKLFNISHGAIDRIVEKYNLKIRGVGGGGTRRYTLNSNYFDNIDTPNKAYILGFLYADGYNCITSQTVKLQLQEQDKHILERINKEIGSNKPLEFCDNSNKHDFGYTYENTYLLAFYGRHITKMLEEKGMIQNKSLILKFPTEEQVPKELISHFVRGYLDGDGCIYFKGKICKADIVSTYDFCNSLKDIIIETLNIHVGIYKCSNNEITKRLTIGGRNQVKTFLDWIYKDADMYLERKYNKYINEYYNSSYAA